MRGVIGDEETSDEETSDEENDPREVIRLPQRIASVSCRRRLPEALPTLQRAAAATIHHLRAPLASALANLEVVEDPTAGSLTETQRSHLQYAIESLYDLEGAVGELLTLACMRDRQMQVSISQVDVVELVRWVHRRMAPRASRLGISLRLNLDTSGASIRTDGRYLDYLVTELVENAIRHSEGHGTVDVVLRSGPGGCLELNVQDEGPGIPENVAGDATHHRIPTAHGGPAVGSTGLGLGIVASLARVLQIRISYANREPGGCVFCLEIPRQLSFPRSAARKR